MRLLGKTGQCPVKAAEMLSGSGGSLDGRPPQRWLS
jgi:hypothetical protein